LSTDSEYNRACLEALAGNNEDALTLLRRALRLGEITAEWAARDPDLEFIRDDPGFQELLHYGVR
jgi:hypothetical protein